MRLFSDTGLVFERYLYLFLKNPVWVILGIVQPVFYLLLFAPLLESIARSPGFPEGGAYNVFVPGLLIQLALFGATGVGFGLIAELRNGVIERLRVTPVNRFALLLGRALRDIAVLMIQATLLIVLSLPFGLRIELQGLLIVYAQVALIGLLFVSISYTVALAVSSEDAYAPIVFTAALPLLLLSGVLLPLSLAPGWLRALAAANPLSYAVDASRAIFNNRLGETSVVQGVVIMAVLAALATLLAARSFGRSVA